MTHLRVKHQVDGADGRPRLFVGEIVDAMLYSPLVFVTDVKRHGAREAIEVPTFSLEPYNWPTPAPVPAWWAELKAKKVEPDREERPFRYRTHVGDYLSSGFFYTGGPYWTTTDA